MSHDRAYLTHSLIRDAMSEREVTPSLSTQYRIYERIKNLIERGSDPVTDLCQSCSQLLSDTIDREYVWNQREISQFAKEEFRFKEDVNIYDILSSAQSEEELRDQIANANQELSSLTQTFVDVQNDVVANHSEIEALNKTYSSLITDINELEYKRDFLSEKLLDLESVTNSAERELRMLHTLDTVPLFYMSFRGLKPVINGFALSLYPTRSDHTNYEEINAAWGLVGLAIAGIISLDVASDPTMFSPDMFYKLTPMRNRVILRRIKLVKMKNSNEPSVFLGPVLNLEGGVSDSYLEAIAALLVVLSSFARKVNRLEALKGVLKKVLDTVDKYGADVAGATYGGGFTTVPHSRDVANRGVISAADLVELLPHWRYLFSSGAETISDLLESLKILLG